MCPACYQDGGSLLHCLSTLTSASEAVYFCCTGLGVTSTGRYPASCPAKPGLSSSEPFRLFSRDYLAWLRAIRPISRVMSLGNHLSRPYVAIRLKRPT